MDTFTIDEDLKSLRPDILNMGVTEFPNAHAEAFRIILRELKLWQLQGAISRVGDSATNSLEEVAATSYPFDSDYFINWEEEIKPAAIRLALSFAYLALAKNLPVEEDGLASQSRVFREEYNTEWALAVRSGFSYDWDASGVITPGEKLTSYRTLKRQ